ncbi:MerR family transcriptional regulator, partial [Enterococcus faecalis]|nr:MerR family transcriptional regulator [Enterococcus faecalis]EGO8307011.1 MerR family transcriptional regulator [Enterococcus faecalis]EKG8796053.1 MerR family transcriptional regulator [Enterococcus faecalis]EKZ0224708.1 MerR family transcriptional regulator [Enterococcus faecalis]HDT8141559.1 MerR family transcriptional regulator [Enterococcus faecalis]
QTVKLTKMSIHTIRFYEKKGLISPCRNSQNNRIFNDDDLSKLQMIKNFKMIGTPLEEIKRFFSLFEERNSKEKRLEFLLHEKNKIDEQIKSIQDGKEFLDSIIKECYM